MRDRFAAALLMVCLVGFVAALGTVVVSGVLLVSRRKPPAPVVVAPSAERPRAPTAATAPLPTARPRASTRPSIAPRADTPAAPSCPLPPSEGFHTRVEPLEVADLHAVDPVAILPVVTRLAMTFDRAAELTSIRAAAIGAGTVDVGSSGQIAYRFEYVLNPGSESIAVGTIEVIAGCWGLFAKSDPFADIHRSSEYDRIPSPQCTLRRAWAAAVASGLPTGATIDVEYRDDDDTVRGSPAVWSFANAQEPTYEREIHGTTCRLVRSYATGRAVPPLGPPPPSPAGTVGTRPRRPDSVPTPRPPAPAPDEVQ